MQVQNNNNNNTVSNIFDDVHLKVQYGNQLRRFTMRKMECTGSLYTFLVDKIALLFAIPRHFQLKYKDDEGDEITISSDDELKFAIKLFFGSTLRLSVNEIPLNRTVDTIIWNGHNGHHGLNSHSRHGWNRQSVLKVHNGCKGYDEHHGWKGHVGNNSWKGYCGNNSWKRYCGNDNMECSGRKGRGGCRGRGGWTLEDIENKIVMVNKKRDLIVEKIEHLKKENSSEVKRLECFLRRLDSRLIKLKQLESEKKKTTYSKCEIKENEINVNQEALRKTDVNHCRRGDRKCQGRGGKCRNDPLFITICALRKEKRELKLASRQGFASESEKADAEKRIKDICQEIHQIIINRREKVEEQ